MQKRFSSFMKLRTIIAPLVMILLISSAGAFACTGITLQAEDGAVVYGRTCEWGAFDIYSRVTVIPRGYEFFGSTPDGKPGIAFKAKYGVVGVDAMGKDTILDGMNEKGLAVGSFYHKGYASYEKYDPACSDKCLSSLELTHYILTQFSTIEEVRAGLDRIKVVPVMEPSLGIPPPYHWIVTQPDGKAIVIEYLDGKAVVFDNPLGVITNSPTFDWHMTNLRNYVNLSDKPWPPKKLKDVEFAPMGAGSGMIGLPGDFTPPSRFVRAAMFSSTARKTINGEDTIYELFRILDSFNVPLGAAEGSDEKKKANAMAGLKSSTVWTTAFDTKNLVFYFHTHRNRRVRRVDFNSINFNPADGKLHHRPLDVKMKQDVEDVKVP